MAEVIQGSKSSLYIKEQIPSISDSADSFTHQSVQNLWGGRGASDVIIHALYATTALPLLIAAGSVKRYINVAAHGAAVGDFIRMNNGSATSEEVAIIKIVDANFFVIAKEINAAIGDELFIMKNVTPTYNKDGSLNVSQGPVQFVRNSVTELVVEDTVTPANNKPMPNKMFIQKDGVTYPINKDTATPSNTVAVPVEIVGVTGQTVTINAGDINVQASHVGANFDSMRIGDGTTLVGVTVSNELKTTDAPVLTRLSDKTQFTKLTDGTNEPTLKQIQTQVTVSDYGYVTNSVMHAYSTAGGGAFVDVKANPSGALTVDASVTSSVLPVDAATQTTLALVKAKTDNLDVALSTLATQATLALIKTKTDNLDVLLSTVATEVTLDAGNVLLGAIIETAPGTDTASSGLNGRLQRIAQRLTSLIAQLPATLGIKTAALSLSVAPASDAVFTIKSKAITASYTENLALTTVVTHTAPANAIGVVIMADDTNANNIRIKQGGSAASLTSGIPLQAGRDITLDCGTDISIISDNNGAAGASVKIYFQWIIQA